MYLAFFLLLFGPLFADSLEEGLTFRGDYYHFGSNVEIAGVVEGDAYLAATQIVITGTVKGNCIAVGGSLSVKGEIGGNLTAFAGQASVDGLIGGSARVFGASIDLLQESQVRGLCFLVAGYADVEGSLLGNLIALAGGLKIGGTLEHNLQTFVGKLSLTNKAYIGGNLKYRSSYEAAIDPEAQIKGEVIYHPSLLKSISDAPLLSGVVIGSKVVAFLMNFLYTFTVGAIFIRFFPSRLRSTLKVLQMRSWQCLLAGALILIFFPLISAVLLITVIGTPFALTLMALNIISFYTVKIFPILWVFNFLFGKLGWQKNRYGTLLAGQFAYHFFCQIPVLGWLLAFAFMILGLGASIMAQLKKG